MTIIAIWCRHKNDCVIGADNGIPWNIPSDMRRFRNITAGKTLLVGRKTYESFPNRTLPNRKILVLTANENYKVSDEQNHIVVTDLSLIDEYPDDIYLCGGAAIYDMFFVSQNFQPDVVIDCVYQGKMNLSGNTVNVCKSVEIIEQKYFALPQTFELDDVITTIWLKKGSFVDQSVVKKILEYMQTEGK